MNEILTVIQLSEGSTEVEGAVLLQILGMSPFFGAVLRTTMH